MPLTEEERRKLLAISQPGSSQIPELTPGGLEVQGVTLGRNSSVRLGQPKLGSVAKPKQIPQGQLATLESTNKAITRLQNLIQSQQSHQFKTGPLSPRFYRGGLGNAVMQYGGTPEERVFKAENERFTNDYITAQTGAQRGFREMQWLQTAIPNPSQDIPENYLANAQSALNDLVQNRDQMLQLLQESGYQAPSHITSAPTTTPLKGQGKLMVDKHGRKAIVFPDGSYQLQ